jgi:uncharacterized protein
MPPRSPAHIDPRSPFAIDTRELGRRAGSMVEVRREVEAPRGWELELVNVPVGAPVELALRLESVVDGVLVSVELHAPVAAECGRCLDPVTDELDVSLAELFVYQPDPDDDEVPVLDGDFLDLEPVLRDAVILALPLNPICDEACLGLCSVCGERVEDLDPGHSHDAIDPRWAVLAPLKDTGSQKSVTMGSADAADQSASSIREN